MIFPIELTPFSPNYENSWLQYSFYDFYRLEEAIEALRDENQRLRSDRDAADAKANDIVKDYEAFKVFFPRTFF